jgi:hypothetical protein
MDNSGKAPSANANAFDFVKQDGVFVALSGKVDEIST